MTTARQLKQLYDAGENISAYLRRESGALANSDETIEISYDLQAGSYVAVQSEHAQARHTARYTGEIASMINSLTQPRSVLEAGVGEATTLAGVLGQLPAGVAGYGFDLSWSRIAHARTWVRQQQLQNVELCTGNLFAIPFADDSIDVVYTSHSIEPNGGREAPILQELYRVARDYLVLLEPGFELASEEARQRMESHGYCKDLAGISTGLGFEVLEQRLFPHSINPLNPTALTIIRKGVDGEAPRKVLACPKFKTPLQRLGEVMFSPEALVAYPILGGIPCLRIENGILASAYPELIDSLGAGESNPD